MVIFQRLVEVRTHSIIKNMRLYDLLYNYNIQKYLKLHKKKTAIIGHLHTPRKQEGFIVVGTFYDGNIYEDDEIIAIGDTHLGLFDYSDEQFLKIKSVLERFDKQIIIMGDFFDFFYMKPADIFNKYIDIIKLIKTRQKDSNLIYIRGNHDAKITDTFAISSVSEYIIGDKIFFHGDICDPLYTLFPLNIFQVVRSKLGYSLHWLRSLYLFFNL